jgi:ATP-dependent exoDNAse (exonuclease V) beta subunit
MANEFIGLEHVRLSRQLPCKRKAREEDVQRETTKEAKNPLVDDEQLVEWCGFMVPENCEFERLKLAKQNEHKRDHRIVFRDSDHKYFVDGLANYTSVTTVIHNMFPEFNSQAVASKMIQNSTFLSGSGERYTKYQKMRFAVNGDLVSDEELVARIVTSWDENGALMSSLGTTLHRDVELYYNDEVVVNETKEYQNHFIAYAKKQVEAGLKPWRTEITVFGEDEKICGSVDMVFIDSYGRYRLRDWKRSKEISYNGYGKRGKSLLRHLQDCNYSHYCLQLNLYKYLIEKYYNIKIHDMGLVIFHPINVSFMEYPVKENPGNVKALLTMHTEFLEQRK